MRSTANTFLVICLMTQATCFAPQSRGDDGSISPETIRKIQSSFKMDSSTRALHNAIAGNDLNSLALNQEVLQGHNTHFSDKIETKGITNQRGSGRCWLFAGLNVMRPVVIERYKLKEFEFSQNYLAFWDKLEKANCFLEYMIELSDREPSDRELEKVLDLCFSDGGWWENAVALIHKYGVVPQEMMPETKSSGDTKNMNRIIIRKLKLDGIRLRQMCRHEKSTQEIRQAKEEMLAEVYRMLVMVLGKPPARFEWRYENKKSKLSEIRSYTPNTFFTNWVDCDLTQYVNLGNDPSQPLGKHYRLSRTKNVFESESLHYANVKMQVLKDAAVKAIRNGEPVWFAADVGKDQDRALGIMAPELFDYESLFGTNLDMSKADRFLYGEGSASHAMVFQGVDIREGRPVKWLVENSWGDDKGDKGYWTLYDKWFDEHVYSVIVKRSHVSPEVLKIFEQEPVVLPPWHPMTIKLLTIGGEEQ